MKSAHIKIKGWRTDRKHTGRMGALITLGTKHKTLRRKRKHMPHEEWGTGVVEKVGSSNRSRPLIKNCLKIEVILKREACETRQVTSKRN